MGVNTKYIKLGFVTPQCSDCGVKLCWDVSIEEYKKYKDFWNQWTCNVCNTEYKGTYKRFKESIMAENSKIEWTDHTANLWWGCAKVHTGCKNCYAETWSNRFDGGLWGEDKSRKMIKSTFNNLDKYQRQAYKLNVKHKVFVGSMMDLFEEDKPLLNPTQKYHTISDLRDQFFRRLMTNQYPNLIFLLLTKRPQNISNVPASVRFMENVWFGTSVSSKQTVPYAHELVCQNVTNRFLSIEPQVDMIARESISDILPHIGWVIQGGESGSGKRPFDLDWAYEMKEVCQKYEVSYFFKQIDKIQDIPQDLMVRQFPKSFKI